jgi:hypothetical protein
MRLGALSFHSSLRRTVIATTAPIQHPPVEACLAQLLDHFGIAGAHFAGRSLADVQGFIAKYPDRVASLTLVCPTVLNPRSLAPLGARLMVVTGDHGLGARRVQAVLPDLPEATAVVLDDYAGLTWADLAADRGDDIDAAIREFHQRRAALPAAGLREQEGEIAGISFRIRGAGPPLVLLPLDLSPGQWEPLIPALSARYCSVILGGPLLGSVASLEERGRSGYMAVVRGLLDALAIQPGESVLEVLHAGAYWLLWSMRRVTPKRSIWRVMQFDTLRLRLIKLAARVVELKTQIKIHLPSSAPGQAIFAMLLDRLPRLVT